MVRTSQKFAVTTATVNSIPTHNVASGANVMNERRPVRAGAGASSAAIRSTTVPSPPNAAMSTDNPPTATPTSARFVDWRDEASVPAASSSAQRSIEHRNWATEARTHGRTPSPHSAAAASNNSR